MLVRKLNGAVFHIVQGETRTHYICLCGLRIFKNDIQLQSGSQASYVRCYRCRMIDNERFIRPRRA